MPRQRLDELFDAAQDIPPERRAAWLDSACANDVALRRELERLLEADARAEGVLESGPELLAAAMAGSAEPPARFGVWRVIDALGAGGMGEVWLAERDDAGFTQRAAIKQVAWPTPGLLQRFQRERQILAGLEHPGVARLIDGGVDDAGCPYLAMEHVEGERIDAWVRAHALDVRATVRLLLKVCDAVAYAHRNLVVHSDIKPSNILITKGGAPRLLDFGIARVMSEDAGDGTRTATRLLTPDYAAPEWLAGGAVTTAVDVYALGVLAYELLSGGKPYRLTRGAAMASQLDQRPIRPPSAVVDDGCADRRARRRAIHGDLDRVVMTAMAHEPARRYPSVEAFARDLHHWLDGRPVAARGDDAWYRLRKFVARNRVAATAAAVVALTLAAATAYSIQQARIARAQMHRAEAVRVFLADTFAQIDPAGNQGRTIGMRELLERSEQRLVAADDVPLQVRVDLATLIGTFYWNLADTVASKRVLERAVDLSTGGGVDDEIRARALLALAQVEDDRGEIATAYRHASAASALALRAGSTGEVAANARRLVVGLSMYQDGAVQAESGIRALLKQDRERHGDGSQAVINDLILLGQALDMQSRFGESEDALSEAVRLARTLPGPYRSRLGLALILLGETQMHRGRYADAGRAFGECATLAARLWGSDNVRSSIVRADLLEVAIRDGQFRQSLPVSLALRDEAERLKQERPDHYANTWRLLGDVYTGLGRLADAQAAYRKALTLWSVATNGHDNRATAVTWSGLAAALKLQGRMDEAESAWRSAVAVDRNVLPAHSQWLMHDLAGLADVLRLRGQFDGALRESQAAVTGLRDDRGSESPMTAGILARHAEALLDDGQSGPARQQAVAALAVARRVLPADNWQQAPALYALARTELAAGRASQAEALSREVLGLRRPRLPESDPRVLEVQAVLMQALEAQGKSLEAGKLRAAIEPLLAASSSPYLAALRERLAAR